MRQTKIFLSKDNLIHNFNTLQKYAPNSKIIPLVKSNAYGHGQQEIISMLKGLNYYAFGIAYTNEAYRIREYDKSSKIILVVPITKNDIEDVIKLNLIPTIESYDTLFELNQAAKNNNQIIKFHLFINSGMNRDGADKQSLSLITANLPNLKNVELIGILSHFASSEDLAFSMKQYDYFLNIIKEFNLDKYPKHISNSNGIIRQDNSEVEFIRPGLFLYGVASNKAEREKIKLKPVLSLKTEIKNIIKVNKGEYVGYSFKYKAEKNIEVGILPIGYGDGYSTLQFNKAECLVKGKRAKIIGSICMDLMMCDVSNLNCQIGEQVTLIGKDGEEEISVNELAENIGVIPYEIITSLKAKIEKVIY